MLGLLAFNIVNAIFAVAHYRSSTLHPVITSYQQTVTSFPRLGLLLHSPFQTPISSPYDLDPFQGPVAINSYATGLDRPLYPNISDTQGTRVYIFELGDLNLTKDGYLMTQIYGNTGNESQWRTSLGVMLFDCSQGIPVLQDELDFRQQYVPLNAQSQLRASAHKFISLNGDTRYDYQLDVAILHSYADNELPIQDAIRRYTFSIFLSVSSANPVMDVDEEQPSYGIFDLMASLSAIINISFAFFFFIFPNIPLVVTIPRFRFKPTAVYDPYQGKMVNNGEFILPQTPANVMVGYESESDTDGLGSLI